MNYLPAEWIIEQFGGVRRTARAIKKDHSTVSRWLQPKGPRGTGGYIPSSAQKPILKAAARLGLDITPSDLILGRKGEP